MPFINPEYIRKREKELGEKAPKPRKTFLCPNCKEIRSFYLPLQSHAFGAPGFGKTVCSICGWYAGHRPKITPEKRLAILSLDNFECVYCGNKEAELTLDHIIPFVQGGKNKIENLVTCCKSCNSSKRDRAPFPTLFGRFKTSREP